MDTRSDHPLEFRHIALLTFLGTLLGIIPFIVAWAVTPEDMVFSGALVNPDDYSEYLSAIQQGRTGHWLYRYYFSPELYQPQLSFPLYVFLGKLAAVLGGSNHLWFHLGRLAFGVFTYFAFLFLVRSLFPNSKPLQRTAWVLMSFGSGFGFITLALNQIQTYQPADLFVPEWNTITNLIDSPHFILALGLLAVFYGALLRFDQDANTWKCTIIAALAGLGIGLVYPFHVPSTGLITGIWLISLAIRQKRIPWAQWGRGAVILAPLSFFLVYYTVFTRQDPLWDQTFIQNNLTPPPAQLDLLLGYGVLFIFAVPAITREWRELMNSRLFLPILWAVANTMILYLPIPFSSRFILGLHIPFATLAAFSLECILLPRTYKPKKTRRVIVWLAIPSTLLFVLSSTKVAIDQQDFPYFYPKSDLIAADWLAERADEGDLTLAHYPISNYIPGVANTRVFVGHLFITIDLEKKLTLLQKFWQPETTHTWREEFIQEWQITYIFQGTYENALSGENLILPWDVIYEQDGVKIYTTGQLGD